MSSLIDGIGPNGKMIVLGAAFDPLESLSCNSFPVTGPFRAG
jgi:hypothetical protein